MSDLIHCACKFDPFTGEQKESCPRHKNEIERLTADLAGAMSANKAHVECVLAEQRGNEELRAELKQANAALRRIAHNICISDGAGLKMRDIALAALATEAAILHPQDDRHIGDR